MREYSASLMAGCVGCWCQVLQYNLVYDRLTYVLIMIKGVLLACECYCLDHLSLQSTKSLQMDGHILFDSILLQLKNEINILRICLPHITH